MNIRAILPLAAIVTSLAMVDFTFGQVTETSGATSVNNTPTDAVAKGLVDGVYRLRGAVYLVNLGVARRIDIAEGQMVTMDGVVRQIPAGAVFTATAPAASGALGQGTIGIPSSIPTGQPTSVTSTAGGARSDSKR